MSRSSSPVVGGRARAPPAPSLSRLNTLLVCSLLLPLVLWLFSSSSNGHTHGGNLAREVTHEAKVINHWVDDNLLHTHNQHKSKGHQRRPRADTWEENEEEKESETEWEGGGDNERARPIIRPRPTSPTSTATSNRQLHRRTSDNALTTFQDEDEDDQGQAPAHPFTAYLPYLLLPLRFLLYLLSILLSVLYYVLLPVLLPLHALVVLPTKLAYALGRALMPIAVFLGSCAVVGGLVGGGAAGVVRGWLWMNEPEGRQDKASASGRAAQTVGDREEKERGRKAKARGKQRERERGA